MLLLSLGSFKKEGVLSDIVGIMLCLPFNDVFDYKVEGDVELGKIVRVSFGREEQFGVVWKKGKSSNLDDSKIKKVSEIISYPPLSPELMKFIAWVADYNMSPIGLVLKMALSVKDALKGKKKHTLYKLSGKSLADVKLKNSEARLRVLDFLSHGAATKADIVKCCVISPSVVDGLIKGGVLSSFEVESEICFDLPQNDFIEIAFSREQQEAVNCLVSRVDAGFSTTLLHGVTGSGKTEVYFESVGKTIDNNRQVLVMVPEIALTSQWLGRFERRFGVKPCCWHSGLSNRQRIDNWQAIVEGKAKVIIGARSALFLPYKDLGLIVVDESHDHSFKQEDNVSYQGRDMAVVRAKFEDIPIILSTATPDLETICNVECQKYDIVSLTSRYAAASMPEVKIVDLRKDKPQKGSWGVSWLAPSLVDAMSENLKNGEQTMLFLNRRGYAPLTICRDCGTRIQCPHCTSWLTEHRSNNRLVCHHCGYSLARPKLCPECKSEDGLTACGPGVERIAEEVKKRFPDARVCVVSSDITPNLTEVSDIIDKMEKKEVDILIGTQILAKGHHFPLLTLVGIIDADLGLMGSDLRACEQTFQLLSQVAGRAGRGDKLGTVYVQTLNSDNEVLKALIDNDFNKFLSIEKKTRKMLNMPPYGKLAAIVVSGENKELTERVALHLGSIAPNNDCCTTLGPAPAPIHMLRGRYRYRLLVKTPKTIKIQKLIRQWLGGVNVPKNVRVAVDIDPYSFM